MKQGFSLIELLIVFTIVSIISVFSIQGAQQLIVNRAHQNSLNLLKTSLYNAQLNSQNTGFTSIICPSLDSQNCNTSSDWSTGWITYQDVDNDKSLDIDESVIWVRSLDHSGISVKFNALGNGEKIVFYPTGRLWPNGNFVICHQGITNKFKIKTLLSGRIRVEESDEFECE